MITLNDNLQSDADMNAAVPQPATFQHRLTRRAREVFENDAKAHIWLNFEIPALGYKKPIDIAQTPEGFEEADALLTRIESGSF
jgi:putative toxin-antitoxin system antitoxin component (TIGR02293 family)